MIFHYRSTTESFIRIMIMKEVIANLRGFDYKQILLVSAKGKV